MAAPLASLADLESELGREVTAGETPRAWKALLFASNLVRAMAPWRTWDTVPDGVVSAVSSLALRRFTARVDGTVSETAGPFTRTFAGGDQLRSFTADERLLLSAALGWSGNLTTSLAGPDAD